MLCYIVAGIIVLHWSSVRPSVLPLFRFRTITNVHPSSVVSFPDDNLGKFHYENMSSQILKILLPKKENNSDTFHVSAQNIDGWYSLEPPRRGGSKEYPQSMF